MKIYTKTGDKGTTGLVGGRRISKNSLRICAIGDVDELNAAIGVAEASDGDQALRLQLRPLQDRLFDLGSELASPGELRDSMPRVVPLHIKALEDSMDLLSTELEPHRNFILPGGSPLAAALHLARSICRRAERSVLALHEEEPVRTEVTQFLNRLSDWLFVAARTANARCNVIDVAWTKSEDK